jgi:hypothetical protein
VHGEAKVDFQAGDFDFNDGRSVRFALIAKVPAGARQKSHRVVLELPN